MGPYRKRQRPNRTKAIHSNGRRADDKLSTQETSVRVDINSTRLEAQTADAAGGVAFEARDIPMESVREAQGIITAALHKEESEQYGR
jgi:hypothetical protein